MSQTDLAVAASADKGQIARYETGDIQEPRRDTLDRIARAVGQPVTEFIEGAGGEIPSNWEIGLLADQTIKDGVKQAILTLVQETRPSEESRRRA